MCGSAKKDSRSRTDKLLSAISLNLGGGTDNRPRADGESTLTSMNPSEEITAEHAEPAARAYQVAIGAAADCLGLAAETAVQEALFGRLPKRSH